MRERLGRLALVLLLATAVPAWAATLVVTNGNDSGAGSLRAQIAAAASGDTIVFAPALDGTTISLTTFSNDLSAGSTQFGPSAFFITGSQTLTIDATANGLTQGVVIARSSVAGTAKFRLFDVGVGSSLTLRGVTLSNGYAEGGYASSGGGALGAGGAIFNRGTLVLDRCTLTGNTALGGQGGASAAGNGGGGVGANSSGSGGGPNGGAAGAHSVVANADGGAGGNGGLGGGGGWGGLVLVSGSGNGGNGGNGGFGGGGGWGGYVGSPGTPGAGGNGGFGGGAGPGSPYGIPGFGGGNPGGTATGYGGAGAGMGGAIFNDAGTVTLTNVTLTANTANGGANGYIPADRGSGYGGAIFNYAGTLTLDFVTLFGNNVAAGASGSGGTADGGAIYSLGDSAAACSAGGNTCTTSGNARLTMNHSIAANSTAGVNDVRTAAIHGGSSTGGGAGNRVGSAADTLLLSALPATLTGGMADVMIPQAGSIAINAEPCSSAIDQRGIARPQGAACDVGAVEVVPANQAALTAIATPASIVFNATSALSTTGGSGTGAVSYAVTAGNAFCAITGSTLTGTGVGTCTVTATKAADDSYNATSATADVTVGQAATTTSLGPPAAIVLGQTVDVSAAVAVLAPGGGTPTGTITIRDGGVGAGDTCTITLPATSCALTPSAAGNQPLTATYSGDTNFTSSNASAALAVGTRPTAITLANSPNPSRVGEPVNLIATVTLLPAASGAGESAKAAAMLTGSVTFSDGSTVLGTVPLDADGTASLVTSTLAQGSHTLTARYSGNAGAAVASVTARQDVDAALVVPVPVPARSVWMLALLGALLAGLRAAIHRQRPPVTGR
ncbi:Ig-like domain repeat protein [Comamonas humi]